jgi:hypothetical protein
MGNCDFWETVDFGRGPVEIRCTQTGTHAQHRTEVFFKLLYSVDASREVRDYRAPAVEHHNVFGPNE